MHYMDNGGAVYLEGVNIGHDHDGTPFWDYFGAYFQYQGQIHTGMNDITGEVGTFAEGKLLQHQVDTYADIYNNWFEASSGEALLRSGDNHIRTVINETENYRTIASSMLVAGVIDTPNLNTKKNLVQLYISYLTNKQVPELYLNKSSLDFGTTLPGERVFRQVLLQNLGNDQLNITNITSSNSVFTITDASDQNLNLGNIRELEIAFSSEESGSFSSNITFNTNDPNNSEVVIIASVDNYTNPQLAYPTAIEAVSYNGDGEVSFELNNLGQQELTYWIQLLDDNRASGHPDLYGYNWIDSDEEGIDFVWNDISEIGTRVSFQSSIDYTDLELPFLFPFYGDLKDEVRVATSGYLTFGEDGLDYSNDPIPSPFQPNDLIAIFWDDLNGSSSYLYHHYDEENEVFIVQYDNWRFYNGSGNLNFQAHLHMNGDIWYYYDEMEGNLFSATIGIENADASTGLQVIYNGNYLTSQHAIKFSYNADWVNLSKWQGVISEDEPHTFEISFPEYLLPTGEYSAIIRVHTNDPDNAVVDIPLTANITTVSNDDNSVEIVNSNLSQNYPNPFNPETTISFFVSQSSEVEITVYNLKGSKVKTLVRDSFSPGEHSVVWNGLNNQGQEVASGVYLYKMKTGQFSRTKKMILVK